MSTLSAFLKPKKVENKEVVISDRFKDEEGKAVAFIIQPISQTTNSIIMKRNTKQGKKGQTILNQTDYMADLVASAVVFPDLNSKELQDAYGMVGAAALLQEMLLVGEFAMLSQEVQVLSGLTTLEEDIEEVKNESSKAITN